MSLWSRLWGAQEDAETRAAPDPSWQAMSGLAPPAAAVSGRLAENLATVCACVSAISTALGSLPAEVQRRTGAGGYEPDDAHPLATLIRDGANRHQSWPDFIEWLIASALLAGNGLAEIVRDATGAIRGLTPIPWGTVGIAMLPSGRLVFDVSDQTTVLGTSGRPRRLLDTEVLWLRDRSDDGLVGRSRLHRAAGAIAPAMEMQSLIGSLWKNGLYPSGALEIDAKLSEEARKALGQHFTAAFAGSTSAARLLVLDQGLKWKSIAVSPEDAELLDSRRFTVEELARVYNVPPPVIGHLEDSNFANSESMQRWFAMATLSPWAVKLEHEFHRSVFSATDRQSHRLDLDLQGLLRGDPETRWASHKIAVEADILTKDEVRALEGWGPRT